MKKRYQALSPSGEILDEGPRLKDVANVGPRILIDYKLKRWTWVKFYPLTAYTWIQGLNKLGGVLRKGFLPFTQSQICDHWL